MKNFTISVILISYNNFKYIFEALDSIFQQTYSDIQLIISDDCSADFKKNKVQKYVKRHAKSNITDIIINVNSKNLGTVKHLENLYALCTGELITILAADDAYADAQVIERFADEYLKKNKEIKVITSQTAMCDSMLEKRNSNFISDDDIKLINSGDYGRLIDELSYRCIMPSSGTAIAPEVYRQIGSLSDDYKYIEDWNSYLRMVRMGIKIRCLETVSVLHRDDGINHSAKVVDSELKINYSRELLTVYKKEIEPYQDLLSHAAAQRSLKYYNEQVKRYEHDYALRDEGKSKKKIVFYFRKGIKAKGDFALFYGIAAELSKNEDYAVYCVNNSFAEMQEQYRDSKIRFCDITDQNRHIFSGATFVIAFSHIFYSLEEIEKIKNAKLFFVVLHPQVCKWLLVQVNKTFSLDSLFKLMIAKNAYAFIDAGNLYACQRYCSKQFEERYFPVNANFDSVILDGCTKSKEDLNIVWYGRLDGDKIYSLINFLDNLVGFDFGKPVTIHLIGDGNAKDFIRLNKYSPQFRFVLNSFMYGEKKDRYLIENADMVLAMGMSSIDAARLKLPVVIPIVSPIPFKENKFVLFCDAKGYCLGTNSEDMKAVGMKTYPAHKIVQLCCCENKGREIGEKCYQFAKENFSIDKQLDNYMDLINNTSLTYKRLKKNWSVKIQFAEYKLYKLLRGGNISYDSYLKFREKLKRFMKKPFKEKVHTIKAKIKKLLRKK